MKLIILSILLVCAVTYNEALVHSKAICAVELVTNGIKCIKKCRTESRCSKLMDHCKKIKRAFLRRLCKGVLKCACPTCLMCVAKCIVRKFMKHNICNVGSYLKAVVTLLGIQHHFDTTKKEGQEKAVKAVLEKVVSKNTSSNDDDDDEEEYEEDDDEEDMDSEIEKENENEEKSSVKENKPPKVEKIEEIKPKEETKKEESDKDVEEDGEQEELDYYDY